MTAVATDVVLSVRNLNAGHGGLAVVRDVDLSVARGQVVALLGPNGAGKTTILQTIAGLLPAISGEILVVGRSPSVRRPHIIARHGLAYVPDSRCLFRSLTVRQNLALAARRSRSDIDSVFQYMPELGRLAKRDAGLLSGGEQQMLAIGRALLTRPTLLMIDELSMGLAPVIVERLLAMVRTVADDLGLSVLFVEQHVRMALGVADSAYVISHGRLITHGSAADVNDQIEAIEASYLGDVSDSSTPNRRTRGLTSQETTG
ncbi:ABC transporter ATP-binding protein [Streptomyces sp. NPDC056910]|uniref:ABC transporter ATP-binding protein n=1 Tax=Streptomyces sp. NPDC056910 TaxID=3345964 RepID=UPI0036A184F0